MYSSPPIHGALLVQRILGTPQMLNLWKVELSAMAERVLEVRSMLRTGLEKKGTPGKWNHITDQIGMFSFTGLSKEQCERLITEHHIYLLKSGRISLAGLNKANVQYMVACVDETTHPGRYNVSPELFERVLRGETVPEAEVTKELTWTPSEGTEG